MEGFIMHYIIYNQYLFKVIQQFNYDYLKQKNILNQVISNIKSLNNRTIE